MQSDTENTRILQESSHTNPVQENRCPTNTRFIFIFFVIVLVWFAVGIQAFARGPTHNFDKVNDEHDVLYVLYQYVNTTLPYLSPPKETFTRVFIFSLFLGGISVFNCIILIKAFTKQFVYISLIIFVIYLLVAFGLMIKLALNLVFSICDIFSLACTPVPIVYAITVIFCVRKVGINMLCEIVKNSTRAIIDCPSTLFFTSAIVILVILSIIFALNALEIILSSDDNIFLIVSFSLIIVTGAIMISSFIIFFAMAVISEYTVNWYWISDKKEILSGSIVQSIIRIFRNHFGTIALQSTLVMPFIYAAVRAIKYKNKCGHKRKCGDVIINTIAKISLVATIAHSSTIHTSIYGSNFIKATKKTFDLVIPNAPLYLATIEIFNMLAVIGVIGNSIVMFYTGYAMVRLDHIMVPNVPLPFFWGFYCPVVVYCILMISVARALLTNKMIILNAERDMKEMAEAV